MPKKQLVIVLLVIVAVIIIAMAVYTFANFSSMNLTESIVLIVDDRTTFYCWNHSNLAIVKNPKIGLKAYFGLLSIVSLLTEISVNDFAEIFGTKRGQRNYALALPIQARR
jgi:flagellar basal body-associated protein FliL